MPPPLGGRLGRRTRPTLALAGAGYIAVVHALAAPVAGLRVASVASRGGSSARHLAGELDARRVTPDQLPDGADVLVVATPPPDHVALALAGLDGGARVLVEKPLAPTLAEADRVVAASAGGILRIGENLLHAPAWAALQQRRTSLGGLEHLSLRTLQPPPDWGHFARPMLDGGVLYDLGPHPVALALELAGSDPVAVSAELSSARPDGADDDARVLVRCASGLVVDLHVSWTSPEVTWDLQAAGPTGVLRLELLPEVRLEHDGEPVEVASRHQVPDPRLEQLGYVDQLVDLMSPTPGGQDARAARTVLEVICAAYLSAGRDGEEVALPLDADPTRSPRQLWGR